MPILEKETRDAAFAYTKHLILPMRLSFIFTFIYFSLFKDAANFFGFVPFLKSIANSKNLIFWPMAICMFLGNYFLKNKTNSYAVQKVGYPGIIVTNLFFIYLLSFSCLLLVSRFHNLIKDFGLSKRLNQMNYASKIAGVIAIVFAACAILNGVINNLILDKLSNGRDITNNFLKILALEFNILAPLNPLGTIELVKSFLPQKPATPTT